MYVGIDIGSISTKGVVIDSNNNIIASNYLWTEGNPIEAVKKLVETLKEQLPKELLDKLPTEEEINLYLNVEEGED